MLLTVKNVVGVKRFELTFGEAPIVILAGRNAAGKTSIGAAIAALCCNDPDPLHVGVKAYRNDGVSNRETAFAQLSNTAGVMLAKWSLSVGPDAGIESCSQFSSPGAVGLIDWCKLKTKKERENVFQQFLSMDPEEINIKVREVLPDTWSETQVVRIVKSCVAHGFMHVANEMKQSALKYKQEWRATTGEGKSYGAVVAEGWRPKEWTHEMEGKDKDWAESMVARAHDERDKYLIDAGYSEKERLLAEEAKIERPKKVQELEEYRERSRKHSEQAAEINSELEKARAHQGACQRRMAEHEAKKPDRGLEPNGQCPECKSGLYIRDGGRPMVGEDRLRYIVQSPEINENYQKEMEAWEKEEAAIKEEVTAAKSEVDKLRDKLQSENDEVLLLSNSIGAAEGLIREYDKRINIVASGTHFVEDEEAREEALNAVEKANHVRAMIVKRFRAYELHKTVGMYLDIADKLGMNGLGGQAAKRFSGSITETLNAFSDTELFGHVSYSQADMALTLNGRPASLLSKSEQWFCNAAMNIAVGFYTDSKVIYLDGIDILDEENRGQFLRFLSELMADKPKQFVFTSMSVDDDGFNELVSSQAASSAQIAHVLQE